MSEHKRFSVRTGRVLQRGLIAATVLLFLALFARFYSSETGFTSLILFGENNQERFIPELRQLDYHVEDRSWGYDAQWYVQLAMRPRLDDPEMTAAIDNLPYRARRILFCWTAYAAGMGQPEWILQIYALQNIVCWLALAWLTLRWLKPLDLNNLARWWAILFSFGVIVSARNSLVDGPSLLLVACGVALVEAKRPWLGSLVLGVGGLGKETTVLGAAALADFECRTWRAWAAVIARGLLVVLPLLLWTLVIVWVLGPVGTDTGSRAFAPPFVELWRKIVVTAQELANKPANPTFALSSAYMVVSLVTQFLFIVLRPQWKNPWWRVGAAYALLMIVLGEAVWEGYPGAASRVVLPLLLAFNILVPKGRWWWWLVLVLGNLTLINTPDLFRAPAGHGYEVKGPKSLQRNAETGQSITVDFDGSWFAPSQTIWDYWRWSEGTASMVVKNPHARALAATLEFKMSSLSPRDVSLDVNGVECWRNAIDQERTPAVVEVVLQPGESVLRFMTTQPSDEAGNPQDDRKIAFRLFDFRIVATGLQK